MIYNGKLIEHEISDYKKLNNLLDIKKYLFYGLIAFLLSRINVVFYMGPIGIAFMLVMIFRNNKLLNITIGVSSILGYLSVRENFEVFDLYIIINLVLIFLSLFFTIRSKHKVFILAIIGGLIFVYKYFYVNFSIFSSVFSLIIEIGIIYILYFVFNKFIKVVNYFNTNQIFIKEEIICLVITTCLIICGLNDIKIFGLDISNILLIVFTALMSYVNGMSIGAICAVFSGGIIGIIYGSFADFISTYSIIATVSSFLYLSSRFTVAIMSLVCILILRLSTISFLSIQENLLLIEIFISMVIFVLIPKVLLNNIVISLNEEHKKEFYTKKKTF